MTLESSLPDVLEFRLATVICGRAAGKESARQGVYYADPSNKFWKILAEVGLTDRKLSPKEFRKLPSYGIGLTDINKTEFGSDQELTGDGDNLKHLDEKIMKFEPRILAFNGKNSANCFSATSTNCR